MAKPRPAARPVDIMVRADVGTWRMAKTMMKNSSQPITEKMVLGRLKFTSFSFRGVPLLSLSIMLRSLFILNKPLHK